MTNTVNLWARLHEQQSYIMLTVLAKKTNKNTPVIKPKRQIY